MAYATAPLSGPRSFRVLHLLAGTADEPIRFYLELTTCDTGPQFGYEALSYVWGDPTLSEEIFCEEMEAVTSRSFMVTINCYNALKSLRLPDEIRGLWIDAICINQTDVIEREAQVAMMGSIYSGASQVVVHLGESYDDSDCVMRYLEDQYVPVEFPRRDVIPYPGALALASFSSRAWFSRTWVLQEIFSAQRAEVRCGRMSISWDALKDYYQRSCSGALDGQLSTPAAYKVVQLVGWVRGDSRGVSRRLLSLLMNTRWCSSSDPRDKLYGILSIPNADEDIRFLRPNYQRSVRKLFTDVAIFLYFEIGPEMFRQASKPSLDRGLKSLPTWVPDWSCEGVLEVERPRGETEFNVFKVGDRPTTGIEAWAWGCPPVVQRITSRKLEVRGKFVSSLSTISEECDLDKNVFPLAQWCKIARQSSSCTPDSSHFTDVEILEEKKILARIIAHEEFLRLITRDNILYDMPLHLVLQSILEWETGNSDDLVVEHVTQHRAGSSYLYQIHVLLKSCDKRKVAVLQNGLMALVPVFSQPGDLVYVLPGASVPFLFRKQDNHYIFIGDCFVQGIMFGEAWDSTHTEPLETLTVNLLPDISPAYSLHTPYKMRLLDVKTFQLRTFYGDDIPPYAILSHTWLQDEEEVTFGHLQPQHPAGWRHLPGARKVELTCLQAATDGYSWAWIDTCCIDKANSSELSEAINSMFKWYQKAGVCYVYLTDIDLDRRQDFFVSRWWTRAWTLQELLAPGFVQFFDMNWRRIGTKADIIDAHTLCNSHGIHSNSVAQRMSWAAHRKATRAEDVAYSLLGIFQISMTMLYGEGEGAFLRLQKEIVHATDDLSLFAWNLAPVPLEYIRSAATEGTGNHRTKMSISPLGMFASHPSDFKDSKDIDVFPRYIGDARIEEQHGNLTFYAPMISSSDCYMPILRNWEASSLFWIALLPCGMRGRPHMLLGLILMVHAQIEGNSYRQPQSARVRFAIPDPVATFLIDSKDVAKARSMHIRVHSLANTRRYHGSAQTSALHRLLFVENSRGHEISTLEVISQATWRIIAKHPYILSCDHEAFADGYCILILRVDLSGSAQDLFVGVHVKQTVEDEDRVLLAMGHVCPRYVHKMGKNYARNDDFISLPGKEGYLSAKIETRVNSVKAVIGGRGDPWGPV
ncbi:hypothetical protein OPT61_g6167 [Boeremia exigua]|uniref:Uncharacterized protein n=1 Tax=Boeremia exigua TaxID=749465 RepID=A0ACC2I7R8_9PLEO|nr:hypothetical protein OPT61_g6167 [Boeremia exigua]